MNSLAKVVLLGPTPNPISVPCVLATRMGRTSVPPTAKRDTMATLGLSGESGTEPHQHGASALILNTWPCGSSGPGVACHRKVKNQVGSRRKSLLLQQYPQRVEAGLQDYRAQLYCPAAIHTESWCSHPQSHRERVL